MGRGNTTDIDDWVIVDDNDTNNNNNNEHPNDSWVVVLLGPNGSGKSATGNSLLGNNRAFKVGERTTRFRAISGEIPIVKTPIEVIDMPGNTDNESMQQLTNHLRSVKFVNAFLLVVNGQSTKFDDSFKILEEYKKNFGEAVFKNVIVVVSHWGMDDRNVKLREHHNITKERFQDMWAKALFSRIKLTSVGFTMPFVFMDNAVTIRESVGLQPGEAENFGRAKEELLAILAMNSVYTVHSEQENSEYDEAVKKHALKKKMIKCVHCKRYYPVSHTNPKIQAAISGATLFTGVGIWLQAGMCAYRLHKAEDNYERMRVALGATAAVTGFIGGGVGGAVVGTIIAPGIGTILGLIGGAIYGSVKLQEVAEQKAGETIVPPLCIPCRSEQFVERRECM